MKLKSFFALLKNPKLAEEGRIHIKIDYEKEDELVELKGLDITRCLKESA